MTVITDSLARDHLAAMQATASSARRAHEIRQNRRDIRRVERSLRREHDHPRAAAAGHAAARPFTVVRHWIVGGEL